MNPDAGYTPDAGRSRPVTLDHVPEPVDPGPRPGDEMDAAELSSFAPEAAAMASGLLVSLAGVLSATDREALLYLLRPNDLTLRGRARVAGVSPGTIRAKALRMRKAMRNGLNTQTPGDTHRELDSGEGDDFR